MEKRQRWEIAAEWFCSEEGKKLIRLATESFNNFQEQWTREKPSLAQEIEIHVRSKSE